MIVDPFLDLYLLESEHTIHSAIYHKGDPGTIKWYDEGAWR
jgi:hypothetical protein